jgi:hypothetical protein
LIAQEDLIDTLRSYWHEAWKIANKEHPRYPSYIRYPYAFAAARLEDEKPGPAEE